MTYDMQYTVAPASVQKQLLTIYKKKKNQVNHIE